VLQSRVPRMSISTFDKPVISMTELMWSGTFLVS
jgi:hypothetical protein